ncbi:hypothetical protein [Paraburkholderia heleia]|uniref:hypothetical protein n=1 Tax=Paraburkholderia heleia TaxID=634127 RepID=UPI003CD0C288
MGGQRRQSFDYRRPDRAVTAWINHRLLADALNLNEDELPILVQIVGLPRDIEKQPAT